MAAPATALAPKSKQAEFKDLLERAKPRLAEVLPRHLSAERVVKIALTATSRSPLLLQCTPASLLSAVMQASQLGLEPGSVLGSAYLVPYRNKRTGQYEAQLIPGYRGLIDLARRSGQILSIYARAVHERDRFVWRDGLQPALEHEPTIKGDPGDLLAVYAVAHLRDATMPQVEVMTRAQVDAIRARSRSSDDGPWATDYEEMARKTVVRRICKYLPLSVELASALELDARAEAGTAPDVGDVIELPAEVAEESAPPAPATKVDALKGKLKARAAAPAPETPPAPNEPEVTADREPGSDG